MSRKRESDNTVGNGVLQDLPAEHSGGIVSDTPKWALKPRKYREVQALTLPLISMAHLDTLFCKVLGEMYEADFELKNTNKQNPTVIRVENLDSGEQGLLICSAIIKSAFDRAGSPLTGRCFKLVSGDMKDGAQFKYRQITITEIEETDEE